MRTPNIKDVFYSPGIPPSDPALYRAFLETELNKIRLAFELVAQGHLVKTYVAPTKPRDGDIRYAEGTSWNPGSGAGIYWYNGSAWAKL